MKWRDETVVIEAYKLDIHCRINARRYVRVNEKSDKGGSFSIREERRDDERTTKREKESTWPREIERWRVLFQKTIARIRHLRVDDRRRSSAHRLTFKGIYWAELGSSQRR